jgi:hypothetical protein
MEHPTFFPDCFFLREFRFITVWIRAVFPAPGGPATNNEALLRMVFVITPRGKVLRWDSLVSLGLLGAVFQTRPWISVRSHLHCYRFESIFPTNHVMTRVLGE